MSDSQEKSDDLIAELAKLMASNAQGSENETKPAVIKLAPLSDGSVPLHGPIRVPGMDTPPPPAARAVRIPGMDKPVDVDSPAPAPAAAPEPKPQSSTLLDFGKPPTVAPVSVPTPLSSLASPEVKPAPVAPTPEPEMQSTPAAAPAPVAARSEPVVDVAPAPIAAAPSSPQAEEPKPQSAGEGESFNFDFGFGSDEAATGDKAQSEPQGEDAATAADSPDNDPIADLIAAELDASHAEPSKPEPQTAEPAPTTPAFPASVEAVPARNFGNTTAGQAPVLIARPTGAATSRATPVAFRPLPQASNPAESDKFAVAPVFGLGGKPAATPTPAATPSVMTTAPVPARPMALTAEPQADAPESTSASAPKRDGDPMDEIENLIGEAVRIELSGSDRPAAPVHPQTPAPAAPVVPPLNTGFAPRRAGLKDNEPQMKSAEAAILAAAAATGAEVGRIEAEAGDDRPYKRTKMKPQKPQRPSMFGGMRQYVGMAVAGTLLLAAGFGLYWVLGMGRGDGSAPVLTADATPAKQAPALTAANTAEPTRSVVFDEIDGVAAADGAETLVSRDETAGTTVTDVASVATPASTDATESGLANRKVRTVTVRPDGTIVNGDEAVAGTEALPVERPNVPDVPGATEPSDLLSAAAAETEVTDPATTATTEVDPIAAAIAAGETVDSAPLDVAALAPTNTTPPVFDASIVAPTPMPRPTDRAALAASAAPAVPPAETETGSVDTETASVATESAPAIAPNDPASLPLVDLTEPAQPVAAVTTASTAPAYVQLSSQRSEGEAQTSLENVLRRWGAFFGENQLEIQRADLGQKGIYYRVRLPTQSLQEATEVCASIKANGGDCFAAGG